MSNRFLLDANVFIEAKNRYYGFDICPGFWSSLVTQHKSRRVFSIDRIQKELAIQDDEIKKWIEARISKMDSNSGFSRRRVESIKTVV